MNKPDERRLHSWKEIAAYFGYDQRTVKRWEQTRGLPVRRLPGARSGVFLQVSDLEAWQRGEAILAVQSDVLPQVAEVQEDTSPHSGALPESLDPQESSASGLASTSELSDLYELSFDGDSGMAEVESSVEKSPHLHIGAITRARAIWTIFPVLLLGIAGAMLWLRDSAADVRPVMTKHIPSRQARELYLDGRFRWNKRTPDNLSAARTDFEQAIRLDPQYAAAYAGLADCYALEPQFADRHGDTVFARMLDAATHALELDDSLAEAHRALAFALFYWKWDKQGSRREFERSLALNPRDSTTHLWFANTLAADAAFDEALSEIELAREIDPASVPIRADLGWILYISGRRTEGMAIWSGIERTDPGYRMAHFWSAKADLDLHLTAPYFAEMRLIVANSGNEEDRQRLAIAEEGFRGGGETGMLSALADLDISLYRQHRTAAFIVAESLARTPRTDEAIGYLELAYDERNDAVVALNIPESFPTLQKEERFQRLVARASRHHAHGSV